MSDDIFRANYQIELARSTDAKLNEVASTRRILKKDAIREAIEEYVEKYGGAA